MGYRSLSSLNDCSRHRTEIYRLEAENRRLSCELERERSKARQKENDRQMNIFMFMSWLIVVLSIYPYL
jgi:hypothetical protein